MMKKAINLMGSFICILPFIVNATPLRFPQESLETEIRMSALQTQSNFQESFSQEKSSLKSGEFFQQYNADISSRYVLGNHQAFYGVLGFGYSQSLFQGVQRENSVLRDIELGYQYLLLNGRRGPFLWIEVGGVLPLESYDGNSDSVMVSEGVTSAHIALGGHWAVNPLIFFADARLLHSQQRGPWSTVYRSGFLYSLNKDLSIGAGIHGAFSLSTTDGPSMDLKNLMKEWNGGSFIYGQNRNDFFAGALFAEWKTDSFTVKPSVKMDFAGVDRAALQLFEISLGWRWDFETKEFDDGHLRRNSYPFSQPPVSTEDRLRDFEESHADGVNQNLFKKSTESLIESSPSSGRDSLKVKLRKKNRSKK